MPYKSTPGPPDFERFVETGNPAHMTRRPEKKSSSNSHVHTEPCDVSCGTVLFTYYDEVHEVDVTYYRVKNERFVNVVVSAPAEGAWRYDNSARQCAKLFVSAELFSERMVTSTVVKVSTSRKNKRKAPHRVAVHPDVWDAIEKKQPELLCGDPIARMHRLKAPEHAAEREAIWRNLRDGGPVLAYDISTI